MHHVLTKEQFKPLFSLTLLALAYLLLDNYFPGCMFKELTGLKCSFCGMTTATKDFFNGQFKASLTDNWLTLPTLVFFFVSVVGKHDTKTSKLFGLILLFSLIAFGIARNLI
ncbi:MAG: DUF2752 domain-containing protein [Sphingobacteriales bacterium]|nr:DUF2752 domain-containing protein [Sphingobacteriales bacterium]MBI3719071.1 DUF2752 domain-containing protein [Sphingobacteriales bacterium]